MTEEQWLEMSRARERLADYRDKIQPYPSISPEPSREVVHMQHQPHTHSYTKDTKKPKRYKY